MADLSYRERRRICKDYYRASRKGWIDKLRGFLRKRRESSETDEK